MLDECGVCGGDGIPDGECDCDGSVLDACGVCGGNSIPGCTDTTACNYSPLAECDVNCSYSDCPVFGCTDEEACNFEADADFEDGTCEFAASGFDCDGNCIADECPGCIVEFACNFNPNANVDDGSCEFVHASHLDAPTLGVQL